MKRMSSSGTRTNCGIFVVGSLISVLLTGIVHSHDGATGIVKERMDAMQDMRVVTKTVSDMFKGRLEFDRKAVIDAADTYIRHSQSMADLFPDTEFSRTAGDTEALPAVWDDRDDFLRRIKQFEQLSSELKNTVESEASQRKIRKSFFKAIDSCAACHKRFREKR